MIANFNFNTIQILHCLFHTNFLCLFRPYFIRILHCILYEFLCVFPYKIFSAFDMNFHEFWMLYPWNNESDCNIWIFWCKFFLSFCAVRCLWLSSIFTIFTGLYFTLYQGFSWPIPCLWFSCHQFLSYLKIFPMKIVVCNKVWIFYLAARGVPWNPGHCHLYLHSQHKDPYFIADLLISWFAEYLYLIQNSYWLVLINSLVVLQSKPFVHHWVCCTFLGMLCLKLGYAGGTRLVPGHRAASVWRVCSVLGKGYVPWRVCRVPGHPQGETSLRVWVWVWVQKISLNTWFLYNSFPIPRYHKSGRLSPFKVVTLYTQITLGPLPCRLGVVLLWLGHIVPLIECCV